MKNMVRICLWMMMIFIKRSIVFIGGRMLNYCGLMLKIRFNWLNCSVGDCSVDDCIVGDCSVDDCSVDDCSVGDCSVRNCSVDDCKIG